MLQFNINGRKNEPLRILCLGAHCDDIEIGCGGAVLSLLHRHPGAEVHWVVLSSNDIRRKEAEAAAAAFVRSAGKSCITIRDFRDGFFPYIGGEIKLFFEEQLKNVSPDVIFTHYRHDRHQDHRVVSELTWNTFRDHCILEYEIPKYDGDLGRPNVFIPLDADTCKAKVKNTLEHYSSQRTKRWFTEDTLLALLRLRGVESASPTNYAEAFYGYKILL